MTIEEDHLRNIVLAHHGARPIVADMILHTHPAPLVLFCHGFKGFKDWGGFNLMAERFFMEGYHLVKFNFSHNGGMALQVVDFPDLMAFSENTYSKEQEDIRLVIHSLKQHPALKEVWPTQRLTLIGHSRGGAMVTLAAARHEEVTALITLAAVADLESRFQAYDLERWREEGYVTVANARTGQKMPMKYGFYEDFIKNRESLDVLSAAVSLTIPTLIIHSKDDDVVAVSEAQSLHQAITGAELFLLEEGGHTFGMSQPWNGLELPPPVRILMDEILSFLKREIGIGHGS